MNIFQRIKHIWKLSEYEPRIVGSEPVISGTEVAQIIKRPEQQKAQFFPRIKVSPADAIINEPTV